MRKEVIVDLGNAILTAKERRDFSKNHPGIRLSFMLRFPNLPLIVAIVALAISVLAPIVKLYYS